MPLSLGKAFDRSYYLRIPFLDGSYNVGIYFNKKSPFLLFEVHSNQLCETEYKNVKINMYKNLAASKFCETFLNLHNYRKNTLDITNQIESIKPEYYSDINFVLNETLILSKTEVGEREFLDKLTVYGLSLSVYVSEFIFLVAERQNIIRKLDRKIVRTTALQIGTGAALSLLEDFYNESLVSGKAGTELRIPSDEVIKLDEIK